MEKIICKQGDTFVKSFTINNINLEQDDIVTFGVKKPGESVVFEKSVTGFLNNVVQIFMTKTETAALAVGDYEYDLSIVFGVDETRQTTDPGEFVIKEVMHNV